LIFRGLQEGLLPIELHIVKMFLMAVLAGKEHTIMVKKSWTLDALLKAYEQHQESTRGLKPLTRQSYVYVVRQFVRTVLGEDEIDVTRLTPDDVVQFMGSILGSYQPSSLGTIATSLRSFFRFLHFEGLCDASLEAAAPVAAHWRLSNLPRGLSDEQYDLLIASLNRTTLCGRRDRAIIMCLATLGLRPGELAELKLDDIDWRAGILHIQTRKTGRGAILPLPREVGQAIVEYLREERPLTRERRIFIRHSGDRKGEAITGAIVTGAVVRALRRVGIEAPIEGAYVLRHTVASRMVQRGASLKEVADILGHRHLDTTTIYAKVDLPALCDVAMPWPEVKL
jgi:integrase/recombinase XerD